MAVVRQRSWLGCHVTATPSTLETASYVESKVPNQTSVTNLCMQQAMSALVDSTVRSTSTVFYSCPMHLSPAGFSDVPEVKNIAVAPLLSVAESTWEAFVSWDTSRPCPLCLFYLTIHQQPGSMEVKQRLKVVGGRVSALAYCIGWKLCQLWTDKFIPQTNVSLHNLEVQHNYSVEVSNSNPKCSQNVSFYPHLLPRSLPPSLPPSLTLSLP